MFAWFKKLRHIVREYDIDRAVANNAFKIAMEARDVIRERTDIHADIGYHSSTIIVAGRYKNQDYVQLFHLADTEFVQVIERLKYMQRYGKAMYIDVAPGFRAVVERALHG